MIDLVLRHRDGREALVDPARDVRLTYAELATRVEDVAERLRAAVGERSLVFLAPGPDAGGVLLYLACLRAGLPLCLAEPQAEPLARLVAAYHPTLVLTPDPLAVPPGGTAGEAPVQGYVATRFARAESFALHPELALLLTTSGSTGSPKLVRLRAANLEANARSIAEYLALGPGERAIQSLPMHYSYGLSVLNSHLVAGGAVVLTPHSFLRPEFWRDADAERCTSFAGVPYMYETLHRLRYDPARHPTLRTYTQAGGGLRRDLTAHFHQRTTQAGARLVVMYGQTEATARISYVPPERLGEKIGSIGVAIPGGRLRLEPVDAPAAAAGGASVAADASPRGLFELVYEGPNVMLGYAERREDLGLGDVQRGVLRTGDLGTMDADGFFSVVGRLKRFAKLFGKRVSLEDVERELESSFPVRAIATDGGERLSLVVAVDGGLEDATLIAHLARFLAVPPGAIALRRVPELPLTATGKKDYKAVETAR